MEIKQGRLNIQRTGVMMSKYHTTQFNHLDKLKGNLYSIYQRAQREKWNTVTLFARRKAMVYDSPSYKKINQINMASLSGADSALFNNIQRNLVEWKIYYTNKNGKVVYVKQWQELPKYIRDNGNFNGNHFWNETNLPWGDHPSVGRGMK